MKFTDLTADELLKLYAAGERETLLVGWVEKRNPTLTMSLQASSQPGNKFLSKS